MLLLKALEFTQEYALQLDKIIAIHAFSRLIALM